MALRRQSKEPRNPAKRTAGGPMPTDLIDMHASFDAATADYIRAEARRHGTSQAAIIRGLVRAGIKAIYQPEEPNG